MTAFYFRIAAVCLPCVGLNKGFISMHDSTVAAQRRSDPPNAKQECYAWIGPVGILQYKKWTLNVIETEIDPIM